MRDQQFNIAPLGRETMAREAPKLGVTGMDRDGRSIARRADRFAEANGLLGIDSKAPLEIRKLAEAR